MNKFRLFITLLFIAFHACISYGIYLQIWDPPVRSLAMDLFFAGFLGALSIFACWMFIGIIGHAIQSFIQWLYGK